MSLDKIVRRSKRPATVSTLASDLRSLGLAHGDVAIAHVSLSSLGFVVGGAVAVIEALTEALGPTGTLVMPAHSRDLSDPALWENPPVPADWVPILREHLPPYDPDATPTAGIGTVPEHFRRMPGVQRSLHPTLSFAARGPKAYEIVADHRLEEGLGEHSPLGRLYHLDAKVLLIGTDHSTNTSLHLAETRALRLPTYATGAPMTVDGERRWVPFAEPEWNSDDFGNCGRAIESETDLVVQGRVAMATGRLMPLRPVIDHAATWFGANRTTAPSE